MGLSLLRIQPRHIISVGEINIMKDAIILSGARTPVGKFMGTLADFSAIDLGVIAARAAIERAGIDPQLVNEVIFGNVVQAGNGQNPARQVALRAGIPDAVSALTINKVCGSGLKAVMLAANGIKGRRNRNSRCGRNGVNDQRALLVKESAAGLSNGQRRVD